MRKLNVRDVLLGLQIALCALLVTASLVALRRMMHTPQAPIGFDPQGVVLAQTSMQMGGYSDKSALRAASHDRGSGAHRGGYGGGNN